MSIIEKDWVYKDMRCLVIFVAWDTQPPRHRCGYVQILEDHPFYKKNMTDPIYLLEANINKPIQKEGVTLDEGMACLFGDGSYFYTVSGHISIHGGVTFTGELKSSMDNLEGWWIGFDCSHWGDLESIEYRCHEYQQMRQHRLFHPDRKDGHFWTLAETAIEVEKLADQLFEIYRRFKEGELIFTNIKNKGTANGET